MTALDILLRHGPMSADDVAGRLRRPLASVYADLVHAEARGEAEVRCLKRSNQSQGRVWAPTAGSVPDEQLKPALRGGALEVF